jgi:hypothetical protein
MSPAPERGDAAARGEPGERPPVFARWSAWYGIVLAELALTILALGWLTRAFQ